ncbi:FAD/FMN-containing isoamyl alcohol oxidase-like protein MreA [Westerdykella ornata]|uniref:FAD/FMN-containing isoamyl alcohol oxidase-like protein MreA n=1 Tax=Westerdykella ornata TaxID=318751 RepID=A0A6A6JUI5_WESOR|nr:FAD/FMN-containing isoamyl alcohol oxidase-like protein MreA [Westerdykella ornata]KAF2280047.1 FAD/FMN-containing isoamyl alcohol oxidase-like protein MreA [Westerdykella ornata]
MLSPLQAVSLLCLAQSALAVNFPFEQTTLSEADVKGNKDLAFGKLPVPAVNKARCKTYASDANWPSTDRWNAFNASLGGALLKGIPPAAACYEGPYYNPARCEQIRSIQGSTNFTKADPTIPNGQWQLGNPCPVPPIPNPGYSCNITAFPAYVVNVTTVKQIQLAVNFARNNNLRLTIKNTGHDFLGRNTGGGALQIWTHNLKQLEYIPSYKFGKYNGKAAKVTAALEQFELHQYMTQHNMTLVAPGSTTVGAYGGFMQGGGFSTMVTSKLGLMSDQVLSLEVVTADGRFVHADPWENADLFWAIRGGGPGNFGVVTSAIVKAHDTMPIAQGQVYFQTSPVTNPTTAPYNVQVNDTAFWKGIDIWFSWLPKVTSAKGVGWNYIDTIAPTANTSRTYQLRSQINLPGMTKPEAEAFLAPMIKELNDVGIPLKVYVDWYETYPKQAFRPQGPGESVTNGRFGSRLFPRKNLEDKTSPLFQKTIASIRAFVEEGGYNFHSVDYTPTTEIAGWPGSDSAVNPHLRNAIMHATGYDTNSYGPEVSPADQIKNHARLNEYVNKWRDASPGAGAYMNEADTEEPNFQWSFYGKNYDRLLEIKDKRDPWQVFYAVTMVGSERWFVEGTGGLPTQQGRLCRVQK